MALVPHKITALAESDADGTDGKNIVAGAVVSLFDTTGAAVTLFDDEAGNNGSTAKQTDSSGQVVVWVTPGEYSESVNGSTQRAVTIGGRTVTSYPNTESMQNSRPTQTGQRAENRERANAQYELAASGYTAQIGDVVASNGRVWKLSESQVITPVMVGAKGDGATDDSSVLIALGASDFKNIALDKLYLSSNAVNFSQDDLNIYSISDGGIKFTAELGDGVTVSGTNSEVSVNIDGSDLVARPLVITGDNFKVKGCEIKNGYNDFGLTAGVSVEGDIEGEVVGNKITNMNSLTNNGTGDSVGASRGVYVVHDDDRTNPIVIKDNTIRYIIGEEGDSIHIICITAGGEFKDGLATIENNTIIDCTRRAVKIQANEVLVKDNTYRNYLDISMLPSAQALISVISSDNVEVIDNNLDARVGFSAINITGSATKNIKGCLVQGNTMRVGVDPALEQRSVQTGVYVDYADSTIVEDNNIFGANTPVLISRSSGVVVDSNKLIGGSGGVGVSVANTCTGTVVSNNVCSASDRGFVVQNAGLGSMVFDNKAVIPTAGGAVVRVLSGAAGSIYGSNYNTGSGATVFFNAGEADDQFILDHRNTGSGSTSSGGVIFTSSIPSTEQPNVRHTRGDVAFNRTPSAGGIMGWRCVSSGIPGTWKEFGTIEA